MAKKKKSTTKKRSKSSTKKASSKKTAKKSQFEDKEVFYVGVKEPIEIRRTILESSKDIIQFLQRTENLKNLREEKEEETIQLKKLLGEITKLNNKLKSSLPKTSLRTALHQHEEELMKEALVKELEETKEQLGSEPAKKTAEKNKKITEKPKVVQKSKPKSELEKLEEELDAIESKLTKIS